MDDVPILPYQGFVSSEIVIKRDELKIKFFKSINMTDREAEIAALVCDGHRNKAIANFLEVAEKTIKYHLTNVYQKVGFSDRTRLAVLVNRQMEIK